MSIHEFLALVAVLVVSGCSDSGPPPPPAPPILTQEQVREWVEGTVKRNGDMVIMQNARWNESIVFPTPVAWAIECGNMGMAIVVSHPTGSPERVLPISPSGRISREECQRLAPVA